MRRFEWSVVAVAAIAMCSAQAASATDMPVAANSMAVAPPYNWSGCYIGASVGGGWSDQSFIEDPTGTLGDPVPGPFDLGGHIGQGVLGGGQVGCNWQTPSNWVWGIEGQFSAANINGSNIDPSFASQMSSHIDSVGTAALRLGYAASNNLLYVKGGGAWVHESITQSLRPALPDTTATIGRFGWMLGAGWEYGLSPNWSLKLEYNYMDFGKWIQAFPDPLFLNPSIEQKVQTVMVGVNYRFH